MFMLLLGRIRRVFCYTFNGWNEIPETMPAYDIIIQANFTDGIKAIKKEQKKEYYYQLNGVKVNKLQKGVLGFQLLDAFKQSCPFRYEFLIPL